MLDQIKRGLNVVGKVGGNVNWSGHGSQVFHILSKSKNSNFPTLIKYITLIHHLLSEFQGTEIHVTCFAKNVEAVRFL